MRVFQPPCTFQRKIYRGEQRWNRNRPAYLLLRPLTRSTASYRTLKRIERGYSGAQLCLESAKSSQTWAHPGSLFIVPRPYTSLRVGSTLVHSSNPASLVVDQIDVRLTHDRHLQPDIVVDTGSERSKKLVSLCLLFAQSKFEIIN